jgi:hypothetical protein
MTMRWCVFVNLSVLCSGRCSQEELRAAVRKIDPNKSPEDVDALIRLGLMIEKHKDVVTEELDEDGESERSIRICSFSASAAAHQPEWTLPTAVCISMRIMLSGAGGCANMLLLAAARCCRRKRCEHQDGACRRGAEAHPQAAGAAA